MESEFEPSLRSAQLIAGFLFLGPVLFWAVGWWILTQRNGMPIGSSLSPDDAIVLFTGFTLLALIAGMFFRRKAMSVVHEAEPVGRRPSEAASALADLHRNLTFSWIMVEAPALLSGLFFVRHGSALFVLLGAVVLVIGACFTFPRASWYGPLQDPVERE